VRVLLASGLVAIVAIAAAQTPQQPTFRSATNLVQVDVIVTDADGEPVDDLTAADFEILDEGRPAPITAFKFVNAANSEPRERYPVRTADDEEREAANEDTRLVAILLDDYHVGRFEPRRFVEPLIAFVRALPATDLVGVYYPLDSPRDVHLTYDRQAAIAAIRKFEGRLHEYFPKHPVEEEHLRHQRDIERLRTQVVLTGAVGLASRLGALKVGRKTLVWVSNGFTTAGYFDARELYADLQEVYEAANRNNVSIYPVDPRGLMMNTPGFQIDTLRILADETGGRALVNRNDLKAALSEVGRDSTAYYLLGFVSTRPSDGKFHRIKVRTTRPKISVNARAGYWALSETEIASSRAAPITVPPAVIDAFKRMADALRPNDDEPIAAPLHAPKAAPLAIRLIGPPTFAIVRPRSIVEPTSRPEFTRSQRIAVRAALEGDPAPTVTAQLLSRIGQKLADLPVTISSGHCEVALTVASVGPGDYVILLSARRGDQTVDQYAALRVLR